MALVDNYESATKSNLAKMVLHKPYACPVLRPAGVKETTMARARDTQIYLFDVNKLDEIFYLLLKDDLLKLTTGQAIPSKEELGNK